MGAPIPRNVEPTNNFKEHYLVAIIYNHAEYLLLIQAINKKLNIKGENGVKDCASGNLYEMPHIKSKNLARALEYTKSSQYPSAYILERYVSSCGEIGPTTLENLHTIDQYKQYKLKNL